ncbi:MAG: DUF485 domain-containing protein [Proteobacteria bacterium]|nr:DUF485 domain-containing protein [Pseudomonadota bacterium]
MSDAPPQEFDRVTASRLANSPEFQRIYRFRQRVRWLLAGTCLAVLAAYTTLVALFGPVAAGPIAAGSSVTWGLIAAVVAMLIGVCVAGAYVRLAERYFESGSAGLETVE